jgi:very-short-patch-repair endonuclease
MVSPPNSSPRGGEPQACPSLWGHMPPKPRTRLGGGGRDARRAGEARGRALAALAGRQHGVVAQRQLTALGFGAKTTKEWLRTGRLHRLHRETFAVGHDRVSRDGRWLAAVLACGAGALLSHRSAAAMWGLTGRRGSVVDVTAITGRQFRPGRDGIRLHRGRLYPGDATERNGIPVTTVARTLFDLAEVVDIRQLRRAWEEADRLGFLRLAAIEQLCEQGYGRRALRPIRRLLGEARAPTFTRSPLEDRFAEFCREHLTDLPEPLTNVSILDHEVDAYWPSHRLVVEMDSWEFHGNRAAFESDRARDAAMQAASYRVIRLTHRRLKADPDGVTSELRAILTNPPPAGGTVAGVPHSGGLAKRVRARGGGPPGQDPPAGVFRNRRLRRFVNSRAALRRRSAPSRSGFRPPARPSPRALPSSPAPSPRNRR